MSDSRWSELQEELINVLGGRVYLLDVLLPPLLFTLANRTSTLAGSLAISIISAAAILVYRLVRRHPVGYIAAGIGAVLLAALLAWLTRSAAGFFLPGLVMDGLVFAACVITSLFKRPLAAWSSHLTRSWPLEWYWHDRVRPAYTQVTWGWSLYFALRFGIQLKYYLEGAAQSLGVFQLLTGWPVLIVVLAGSYIFGIRRLQKLQGPSVEEFQSGSDPPWKGQKRGF